jgi:hypothetical protein
MIFFAIKSAKAGLALAAVLLGGAFAARGQDDTHVTQVKMVNARAMLSKGFDAKNAKQGDAIVAKIENDVRLDNGQTFPRNTVLTGHVDQVKASEAKGDSTIAFTFDKAQVKGAEPIVIKTTILGVDGPPTTSQVLSRGSGDKSAESTKSTIQGVALQSSPGDATSGTLISKGKNVHIPDGAQFTLGVAILPPGTVQK